MASVWHRELLCSMNTYLFFIYLIVYLIYIHIRLASNIISSFTFRFFAWLQGLAQGPVWGTGAPTARGTSPSNHPHTTVLQPFIALLLEGFSLLALETRDTSRHCDGNVPAQVQPPPDSQEEHPGFWLRVGGCSNSKPPQIFWPKSGTEFEHGFWIISFFSFQLSQSGIHMSLPLDSLPVASTCTFIPDLLGISEPAHLL